MKQQLAGLARLLYPDGPWLMRKMAHWRIRICPFEILISFVKPGASVLDAGCGNGLFLGLLAGTLPSVNGHGFDSSVSAILTADRMSLRAQGLGFRPKLQFHLRSLYKPWPAGLFDVVSLIDVLHHVPPARQKAVFQKAINTVGPGGVFLYKDMAKRPFLPAAMNRLHDLVVARQWIHYVPVAEADRWAEEIGFVVTHSDTIYRLWYKHELRLYQKRS